MTDDVAKALCSSAGRCIDGERVSPECPQCNTETGECTMWPAFRHEAKAAIWAAHEWFKRERRWPGFVKEPRP